MTGMLLVIVLCAMAYFCIALFSAQTPAIRDSDGGTVEYTNAGATTILAGTVRVFGRRVGINMMPILAGETGVFYCKGVFSMPKKNETLGTKGQTVFWDIDGNPYLGDSGTGAITATQSAGVQAGFIKETASATAEMVLVDLQSAAQDLIT